MKNLKKFEIPTEKQKNVKGGQEPKDEIKCCQYNYLSGMCIHWVSKDEQC